MPAERLQKHLARCGAASRRASEALILAGRVAVNGVVVTELGVRVDPERDAVTLDGVPVRPAATRACFMLNKPAGYVTTLDDPQGRPTVALLFPPTDRRLFPVGRLDKDTTGLLLLTDDGELANLLMHPRYHVAKTYLARVDGHPGERALQTLRDGIMLDDGRTKPAEVTLVRRVGGSSDVRITIHEGRKRQVRRMFSAIHAPVRALTRERFGPIELGDLPEGAVRELAAREVAALREAALTAGEVR